MMNALTLRKSMGAALAAAVFVSLPPAATQALPPGFVDEVIPSEWDHAVGICFAPDGRGFVWEQAGRVWIFENGVKSSQPLIDISEEVGNWRDLGLLGFAIDPDFYNNGYIYLLYVVDYHHLRYYGTPDYDPAANQYHHDTIARLTRYTANAADGFRSVDPASRRVLVGESISTGFPITHESHSIGTVMFGEDGSLIVGNGDGSTYLAADAGGWRQGSSNTALADGIITPEEDVGAFRAQMIDSLSGKILRLDPATGDGLPGNPFFDPANPRSARSRVWALGLRNPFRFDIRPGTGHSNGDGFPGVLYIGDVGWNGFEEINVVTAGGQNFGWPVYEGLFTNAAYVAVAPENRMAPNPLAGLPGCGVPFFRFHQLIVQETLAQPSWPNPCNPAQQIPAATPTFMHTRPVITWGHGQPTRVPTFSGQTAASAILGAPDCPVIGEPFGGQSSSGGVWCTNTTFPDPFRNSYIQGDFIGGWLRAFLFDDQHRLTEVVPFAEGVGPVVCLAVNPADGTLYYLTYSYTGQSILRRISSNPDRFPVVHAAATPDYGPIPLTVSFSSEGTHHPTGDPITYQWDFGDGSAPSYEPNPTHTYTGLIDLTSEGQFIARVFELSPPHPLGMGSRDIEILRDKDFPPAGSDDNLRQYDTYHMAHQGQDDYIGYVFDTPYVISRLVFQEGKHFFDGGWFDSFTVEYRADGQWHPVPTLFCNPPYAGDNGVNFDTYTLTFSSVLADGIRIRGVPGGSNRFISVAELRVSGFPLGIGNTPRRYDATLTVSTDYGASAAAVVSVSAPNTPPVVDITSPVNGDVYRVTAPISLPLTAVISDAEHTPDELECRWQVILHRDDQAYPEPPISGCAPTINFAPVACDDATTYYEFALTVTDAHGLSTTRSVFLYPACCVPDWDLSGGVNSSDISAYLTDWFAALSTGSLVPDVSGNGRVDSNDVSAFIAYWLEAVAGNDRFCSP